MLKKALLSLVVPAALLAAQNPETASSPTIKIAIPANVPSETIQVLTFLRGPFGGSEEGPYAAPPNLRSIEVSASHDGRPASEVGLTIYMPGCEFVSLRIPVRIDFNPVQTLVCTPLPKVSLSGFIPRELTGNREAELVLQYRAFCASRLGDGGIPTFEVARVVPGRDGRFDFDIADYSTLSNSSAPFTGGDFLFGLRDPRTLNWLAPTLIPEEGELRTLLAGMKVLSHYPKNLKLIRDSNGR
jgi:hypothetical protein